MAGTKNATERRNGTQARRGEEPAVPEVRSSLWELPARELLELIASTEPTPGGGSAALVAACMGTALLRKAFAVSLKKECRTGDPTHALERALAHLDAKEMTLRNGADQDANAFDNYIRALRLPHGDSVEAGIREKAREEALVRATSLPVSLAGEVHALFRFALDQLPSIDDVILSDAITGLRLLNSATGCLLLTAESNLAKVLKPGFQSAMSSQIRDIRHSAKQAESQLVCRLESRQFTRTHLQ
jgi:methenyltetrahydrofolate cyclohydrolase